MIRNKYKESSHIGHVSLRLPLRDGRFFFRLGFTARFSVTILRGEGEKPIDEQPRLIRESLSPSST